MSANDVSERLLRFPIEVSMSVEDFWKLRLEMSDKLRKRLAALPSGDLGQLKQQALDASAPTRRDTA